MVKFTILFITLLVSLFALELFEPFRQAVILPFTEFLATVSSFIMRLFDSDVVSNRDIIQSLETGAAVQIAPGCNGVEAVIILLAARFAFPAPFYYKLLGFVCGFFAIQLLNLVRIISLFYLLQWDKTWFDWFHLYLWQALIILDALVVWLIWLKFMPKIERNVPNSMEPTSS